MGAYLVRGGGGSKALDTKQPTFTAPLNVSQVRLNDTVYRSIPMVDTLEYLMVENYGANNVCKYIHIYLKNKFKVE